MSNYGHLSNEVNQSRDFSSRLKEAIRKLIDSGKLNCASLSDEGGCKVIICKANAKATLVFRFPYFTNVPGRHESNLRISKPSEVSDEAYGAAGYGQGELIHLFDSTPGAPYGGFKDAIDQLIKVAAFLDGDLLAYGDSYDGYCDFQLDSCAAQGKDLWQECCGSNRVRQLGRFLTKSQRVQLGLIFEIISCVTVSIAVSIECERNLKKKPEVVQVCIVSAPDMRLFESIGYDGNRIRTFDWDASSGAPEGGFKRVIDELHLIVALCNLFSWNLTLDAPSESVLKMTSNLPSNFPAKMEFTKEGIFVSWSGGEDATKTFHVWDSIPGEPFGEALIDVLVSHGQVWLT